MTKARVLMILVCIMISMCPATTFAEEQSKWNPIVINGYFDDWNDKPWSFEWRSSNPHIPNDSLHKNTISLFRDSENVYLYVKVYELYAAGIPGDGKSFQFWCDGRKVTFMLRPAQDIYMKVNEMTEEQLLEQSTKLSPDSELQDQIPQLIEEMGNQKDQGQQVEDGTDTEQSGTTDGEEQQDNVEESSNPQEQQGPEEVNQNSEVETQQNSDQKQNEQIHTEDENNLLAAPEVAVDNFDETQKELTKDCWWPYPLELNELPEGSYPLDVIYESEKYIADGAEAYLNCNNSRIGDEIEVRIPYEAFAHKDPKIDPDNIKTIEFQNPHLTHRKIICTGTDTAPYIGVLIALSASAGGACLWRRKGRKASNE